MTENKQSLRTLAEFSYTTPILDRGYAGQTLYVNVGSGDIQAKPVTDEMKETFIGGRGFDLWLLWHGVNDTTRWDSPENEIVISIGPCGGTTQYPGSGKSIAATISPADGCRRRQQRGRALRPAAQVRRVGRHRAAGQGRARRRSSFIDGPSGKVAFC